MTHEIQTQPFFRNIKSSNILIDACGTAKLADFGCFKSLEKFVILNSPEKNEKPYFTPKNKFCWQAPEVIKYLAQELLCE